MTIRDVVIWAVGALAIYLVLLCVRLFRVRAREARTEVFFSEEQTPPETIQSEILGGPENASTSVHFDGTYAFPLPASQERERTEPRLSRLDEPEAGAFGFDALMEVRQTRHLLDELRANHEALSQRVLDLSEELQALRAACQVSPMYSDAVALARRGYDVEAIAERCGISIAKAQLVFSLSAESKR